MTARMTVELVIEALEKREPTAIRDLVGALTPVVRTNVVRVLCRRHLASEGRRLGQYVDDLTQEVFAFLLTDGGRKILSWNPELGTASAYFGVLTRRHVHNILDSRRQSPWTESPTEMARLEATDTDPDREERLLLSRDMLSTIGARLMGGLNERDRRLFTMLFVAHEDDAEICADLGLERDALYQARSRLLKRTRALLAGLTDDADGAVGAR